MILLSLSRDEFPSHRRLRPALPDALSALLINIIDHASRLIAAGWRVAALSRYQDASSVIRAVCQA